MSVLSAARLIDRLMRHRLDQLKGRAPAAERLVQRVRPGMDLGRLFRPDVHKRPTRRCLQVGNDRAHPVRHLRRSMHSQDPARDRAHPAMKLRRVRNKTMIRHRPQEGRRGFDGIDSAHGRSTTRVAPARKVARIAQVPRCGAQEIALNRKKHIYLIELRDEIDGLAVCRFSPPPARHRG